MRTVTFKSVFEAILRRHGMDPRGDAVASDTGLAVCEHINARVKRAWFAWEWPEWTITEERAFRQIWNDSRLFYQVGADGKPDEVFYIPNVATHSLVDAAYYRVKTGGSNPPLGTLPTNTTYWEPMDTVDTYVAFDQICRRRIGEVLDVFANNPAVMKPARTLGHRPTENGIQIYDAGGLSTVFVRYLTPAERFTIFPYIASRTYLRGDVVYVADQGECYVAITVATDKNPATEYSYWRRCLMPEVLAHYVRAGAFSDSLRESDTSDERDPVMLQIRGQQSAAADQEAEDEITRQMQRLQAQGQHYSYLPFGVVVRRTGGAGALCTVPGYVLQGGGAYDYGPIAPTGSGITTIDDRCETEWGYIPPPPIEVPLVLAADTGIMPLVNGQSYIDVVFEAPKANNDWVFTELRVLNTIDAGALNIWPGIVTNKTTTGFRLQLNGTPDTINYYLQWTINEITTAASPATSYVLSGPATGAPGIPATFTVHLPSHTTATGILIVTPSDGGAGGTFSPSSVGLTTAAPSAMFTYTAPSAGAKTISATNNGGLIDPASVTFTAAYATTYTLLGPTGGDSGTPSTNFTVALIAGTSVPAPVTVTPSAGGGTFTPTSVVITTGAPSATFTYTPASAGAKTISVTNSGGLTNPANLTYTAVSPLHLLDTLISYWKLDETGGNRADSKGSNTLAPFNGPAGGAGLITNAAYFTAATSQALNASSNSSLQVTSDFTFSVWVKLTSQGTYGIITKGGAAPPFDYLVEYSNANGFYLIVQNALAGSDLAYMAAPVANGVWTHIVAWFDSATGQAYIRINDTTTYQSTTCPGLVQTAGDFSIGSRSGLSNFSDAVIDEVGFWKRKLTTAEKTALYNGGAGLPFSSFTA